MLPEPKSSATQHGVLAGAIRTVAGLTLVSRFAGLARDVVTAHIFGNTAVASAFRAAYAVPNLFRRLFGEGALSAAFLPEYAQLVKHDPTAAHRLASLICWLLALVTGMLTLIICGTLGAVLVIADLTPETTLSVQLMICMLPMMPMVCITAILGGMLQVHGRFGPPAAAPIILNVFQIAVGAVYFTGMFGSDAQAAFVIGVSAVGASIVQIVWSLAALRGRMSWTRVFSGVREEAIRVRDRFFPVLLGLGTLQLNTMLDMVIAMWPIWVGPLMFGRAHPLDGSSNAILSYTQSLYQFPLGVFGIAVATAVFPLLARAADDPHDFADVLRRGLRLSLYIGLPASIGLILVRHDLVAAVFAGRTSGFDADGVARAANVLLGFAPGVWAYSLNHVFTRAFYARGDTRTPMRVSIAMVGLNVALNFTLLWQLREAGLAWATGITATVQFGVLSVLCARRLGVQPLDPATLSAVVRIIVITALLTAAVGLVLFLWPMEQPMRWREHVMRLMACVAIGAATYAAASIALRAPELRWLLHPAAKDATPGPVGLD